MFHGKVLTSIDDKGRLIIPSKFRKHFSGSETSLFVTPGRDDCLWLYPSSEWEKVQEKLAKLSSFAKDPLNLRRMLVSETEECQLDSNHRILIPKDHLLLAKIGKEVLITGQLERMEIWNPEEHKKYFRVNNIKYEDVIDRVLEGNNTSGLEIL